MLLSQIFDESSSCMPSIVRMIREVIDQKMYMNVGLSFGNCVAC